MQRQVGSFHALVFCTLAKATIPTMFSSQHHSWIVSSSVQVPFIVKLRLTNRGFVARYLRWLNWTWGKWNITDSNIIWTVSGPCTRRSGVDSSKKKQSLNVLYVINHTRVSFSLTVFLVKMDMVCIEHQSRITEKSDRRWRVSECKVDCIRNILHLCVYG